MMRILSWIMIVFAFWGVSPLRGGCEGLASASERQPGLVVQSLLDSSPDARASARESCLNLGACAVPALLRLVAGDDPLGVSEARAVLFDMVLQSSAFGHRKGRASLCAALCSELDPSGLPKARAFAAELMGFMDLDQEAVNALAKLLRDPNPMVVEAGRASLSRQPGKRARRAMEEALKDAPLDRRIGLTISLGQRGESGAVKALVELSGERDVALRAAAVASLGAICDKSCLSVLEASLKDPSIEVRTAAGKGLLRLAESRPKWRHSLSIRLYRLVFDKGSTSPLRCAALAGISRRPSETARTLLSKAMADPDPQVQAAARQFEAASSAPR